MWPERGAELTFNLAAIELPPYFYFPDMPKVHEAMVRMYANVEHNDGVLGDLES